MAQKVLIMGESGTGKSTSLRNCDPATTAVINPVGKPLPFKNHFEMLNNETDARKIVKYMKEQCATGKKLLVVDDFQYILAVPYMNRIKETGWDKYNDFGANYFEIIDCCKDLPDDVVVVYMTHLETLDNGLTSLGNGTGRAEKTTTYEGGVAKEYTIDGKTSVCWRGKENFWGNIWKFVYGINIWGNGKMGGGQPYICSDFSFAESKNSGNYEPAGFTVTNANGYISAMGYSTACDWLFIASECLGNSSLPVGDYTYITVNLNGYRIARLGGSWSSGGSAGGFYWDLHNGVGYRNRSIGGRLVYIPTRDSATYTAAIEAWKQKMAA